MTNKSIFERLKAHENAGRLAVFIPLLDKDETERRRILLLPTLHRWLYQTGLKKRDLDIRANIKASLAGFVKGGTVNNRDDLKLLEPYDRDLWEFRIRFTPQSRIFGAFVCPDMFVCTNIEFRDDLGRKGSARWLAAEAEAIRTWDKLFPGCRRFRSANFEHLVTGGYHL